MTESLHCPPETSTTLLIGYTPKYNEKSFKNEYLTFSIERVLLLRKAEMLFTTFRNIIKSLQGTKKINFF